MNKRMGQLALLVLLLGLCFGVQATEKVTIYLTDAQGTVLATEDAHGNTLTTYAYRPYGTQVRGAPANGPGYTGHVDAPDTGLVYMQARYYDPGVGRFLSSDPVSPEPGNLFNFGRYTYTNNNPINHTDPDGRCVDGLTCGPMVQSYAAGEMAHPNRPLTPVDKVIAAVGTAAVAASGLGAVVEVAEGGAVLNKALSDAEKTSTTLQKNVAQGKAGEALIRAKYGDKISGEQVTIKTSDGTRTRTGFVTKDGGGIETKTGGASLSKGQTKLFHDINAGREVTPVGKNATNAGLKSGQPTVLKSCTIDRC